MSTRAIDDLIASNHTRWKQGAEDFGRLLRPGMRKKRPDAKTVRSAIYGNMHFDADEMLFIESFYLQRLRHVSQMGLLYLVYPDARHSRFEHSLGVLHSLKGLLQADEKVKKSIPPQRLRSLYFAALLHDCGHGPFSHTTESLLAISGLDLQFRRKGEGEEVKVKPHERRCRDMIHDTDFHLANLDLDSYSLKAGLETLGADASEVSNIILGSKATPLLNLLSGDFDVDKMDYFRRDAFFTGTMGGGVDMDAIQRWISIFIRDGYPIAVYDKRLVGHLLHLLYAREHVYNVTAFHPVARIAAALILVAGDLALRALPADLATKVYANIELFDDREFLTILELAARDAVDQQEGEILQRIVQRLYLRRLPKRVATMTRNEFLESFAPCIAMLESDTGSLPELAYCRVSAIADGRYSKMLRSGGSHRDDVAILELSPNVGAAGEAFDSDDIAESALSRIQIQVRDGEPHSLTQWINENVGNGAAAAHVNALRAYRLSIWRALVLVPAALGFALKEQNEVRQFIKDFSMALSDPAICRPLSKTQGQWASAITAIGKQVNEWRDVLASQRQLPAKQKGRP